MILGVWLWHSLSVQGLLANSMWLFPSLLKKIFSLSLTVYLHLGEVWICHISYVPILTYFQKKKLHWSDD